MQKNNIFSIQSMQTLHKKKKLLLNFYTIIRILFFILFLIISNYTKNIKSKNKNIIILHGKTMGTYWQIKMPYIKKIAKIKKLIQQTLDQDENMLSPWKKNSIISKFNRRPKNIPQKINKRIFHIIKVLSKINKKTNGKLDITIGKLINMWGFGTTKKIFIYPSKKEIQKNISNSGMHHLKLTNNSTGQYLEKDIDGIEINLSTIGEGFAIDHLSHILKKEGLKEYTISVGGAVLVKLPQSQNQKKIIAIQKPTDLKKSVHLLVNLKNQAISTAGIYRNYYQINGIQISHLINPKTGKPIINHLLSVSVISLSALEADSWDTGLLLLGLKKAKKVSLQEKLAVCLITKKNHKLYTWMSPEFKKFLVHELK